MLELWNDGAQPGACSPVITPQEQQVAADVGQVPQSKAQWLGVEFLQRGLDGILSLRALPLRQQDHRAVARAERLIGSGLLELLCRSQGPARSPCRYWYQPSASIPVGSCG